jgi:hypothetical protein
LVAKRVGNGPNVKGGRCNFNQTPRNQAEKHRRFDLQLGMQRAALPSHAGCLPVSAASASAAAAALEQHWLIRSLTLSRAGSNFAGPSGEYYLAAFGAAYAIRSRADVKAPWDIPKIDEKSLLGRRTATAVLLVFDGRRPKIFPLGLQ